MKKGIRGKYILVNEGKETKLLNNGEIVIKDGVIEYVGTSYEGTVTQWYDTGESLILPGFINLHTHPISSPLNRSLWEEQMQFNKYYELPFWIRIYNLVETEEEQRIIVEYAIWDLLRKGTTTAVFVTMPFPNAMAELLEEVGIRAYVAPSYRDGNWLLEEPYYSWDKEQGRQGIEKTLHFIEKYHGKAEGRILGILGPEQVDTCSPELLRCTSELAEELDLLVTTHAGQSLSECSYIYDEYGLTPIQMLERTGLLNEKLIIAHAIFLSHHSAIKKGDGDIELLKMSGSSIAHCPWVFARQGIYFETLDRFHNDGINVGIGTDVAPQDMIEEMRIAAILCRILENDRNAAPTLQMVDHITVNGAKALRRNDLGRIAPGCRADLNVINLENLDLRPIHDPMRTFFYHANGRHIDTVIVDGKTVVKEGHVLGINEKRLSNEIQTICERIVGRIPQIADGNDVRVISPGLARKK